jgi:endonuclease/exonuclease/phosphatase family metal-dependent hydrolase
MSKADIMVLQELESLELLDRFSSQFLASMRYKHRVLVDSHDPRFIDVGVLSRYPIRSVVTHREERNAKNTTWLFSRDCLEVEVDVDGKRLWLYVNHFKSMIPERDETRPRRLEQVARVRELVDERWGPSFAGNFAVLGDFNDYEEGNTSLGELLGHPKLVNVVNRLPAADRWTHFWAEGNEYRQLDYILLPKDLADANPGPPTVVRHGLPFRAEQYKGARFDEVGQDRPKASDHCPVWVDVNLVEGGGGGSDSLTHTGREQPS